MVVIENNPKAVGSNMAKIWGSQKEEGVEPLIDLVFEILDNGTGSEKQQVYNALRVRWIPENANESLNIAHDMYYEKEQEIKRKNKLK